MRKRNDRVKNNVNTIVLNCVSKKDWFGLWCLIKI
jgi:hypothetical protein